MDEYQTKTMRQARRISATLHAWAIQPREGTEDPRRDLGNVTSSAFPDMCQNRRKHRHYKGSVRTIPDEGFHVPPRQPRPDAPVMVTAVPGKSVPVP